MKDEHGDSPRSYVCTCFECGEEFMSFQKTDRTCLRCFGESDGPYNKEDSSKEDR